MDMECYLHILGVDRESRRPLDHPAGPQPRDGPRPAAATITLSSISADAQLRFGLVPDERPPTPRRRHDAITQDCRNLECADGHTGAVATAAKP
jgi:hypothetical protein